MHESQSRLWENLVGRSLSFWRHFFPRLAELFPEALAGYDVERWYREVRLRRTSEGTNEIQRRAIAKNPHVRPSPRRRPPRLRRRASGVRRLCPTPT